MSQFNALPNGICAADLIGTGIIYVGNHCSPSCEGAITSFEDGLLTLRLEDGRCMKEGLNCFVRGLDASIRPIYTLTGKLHGAPYLARLGAAHAMRVADEAAKNQLAFAALIREQADLAGKVKFMAHYVTDGTVKCKCSYSAPHVEGGKQYLTIYAREYSNDLFKIISAGYINNTDSQSDYFDKGRVRIPAESALYPAALARYESNAQAFKVRQEALQAKRDAKRSLGRTA